MSRSARHEKIVELILKHPIDTQEELAARLEQEGFVVTQATVSRDIRALKLTKVARKEGGSRYALFEEPVNQDFERLARILRDAVTKIHVGQNLVVIHTVPGMAMGAATALDYLSWKAILGCIAGDDTVFCACLSNKDAELVALRLGQIVDLQEQSNK